MQLSSGQERCLIRLSYKSTYPTGTLLILSHNSSPNKAVNIFIYLFICRTFSSISPLLSSNSSPLRAILTRQHLCELCLSGFHPFSCCFLFFFASGIKRLFQQQYECVISAQVKFKTNGSRTADMFEFIHWIQRRSIRPRFSGTVGGRRLA